MYGSEVLMPQIFNFPSPRVLQLMRRIESEKDRGTLEQLFWELNVLLNEDDRRRQPSGKLLDPLLQTKSATGSR